ncbi:MAG: AMP-binding protein [Pseudomonadota bacterium]
MILRSNPVFPADSYASVAGQLTLDQLLRNLVKKNPSARLLSDPPDAGLATGKNPQSLTTQDVECRVERLAGHLRDMGLRQDDIVAVRMPNSVDLAITLLAIWRAGLIASPLPLGWRRREWVPALTAIAPKALITTSRIADENAALTACQIAERQFSIRFVAAFGQNCPDGVFPLDAVMNAASEGAQNSSPVIRSRSGDSVATVTWMETADGTLPVARCHASWVAMALRPIADMRLTAQDRLICPMMLGHAPGFAVGLTATLLTGASLILHHPFSKDGLAEQMARALPTCAIVPSSLIHDFCAREGARSLRSVLSVLPFGIGACDAPEHGGDAESHFDVLHYASFGELGLIPGQRLPDGALSLRTDTDIPARLGTENAPGVARLQQHEAEPTRAYRRYNAESTAQKSQTYHLTGAMAPDGIWSAGPGLGRMRSETIETVALPVRFHSTGDGGVYAASFASGISAIGGLSFDADGLERVYGRLEDAESAMIASDHEALTVGIVPAGTEAPSETTIRVGAEHAGVADYKIADRIATLTSLPRDADGQPDRATVARKAAVA